MSSGSDFGTFSDDERSPSPGSSGSSASDEYEGTVLYRRHLSSAAIFIHELQETQCPPHIRSLIDLLTGRLDVEAMRALDVEASSFSVSNPLRDTAAALASQVGKYRLENKAAWMDFHKCVFAAFAHPFIFVSLGDIFEVGVRPSSDHSGYLSMPAPDLAFGLASPDYDYRAPPSCLDPSFLSAIRARGIQAYPRVSQPHIVPAFPWVIFEAVSGFEKLLTAENRAAHGAAKALAMIQTLRNSYYQLVGAHVFSPLPVIAICAQGEIYEVFLAFELRNEEVPISTIPDTGFYRRPRPQPGVHLVRIWLGALDSTKMGYRFQLLLQRLLHWTLQVWQPTIISMLETIKATMSHSEIMHYADCA